MGRPKEFDREIVLTEAMNLFWAQGYSNTNLPDLIKKMGLSRSSFYNEFKDKESLFVESMDLYFSKIGARRVAILNSSNSVKESFRLFFESQLFPSVNNKHPLGCFSTNTAALINSDDPRLALKVKLSFEFLEKAFLSRLKKGQVDGQIPKNKDVLGIAKTFVHFATGNNILVKVNPGNKSYALMLDTLLQILD